MSYNFNKYYLNSNNTEDIINNKINDNIKYKENNFENPEKKSFFSRNLGAGIDNLQGQLLSAASIGADIVNAEDLKNNLQERADLNFEEASLNSKDLSLDNVDSPTSFLKYAAANVINQAPNLLLTLGTGAGATLTNNLVKNLATNYLKKDIKDTATNMLSNKLLTSLSKYSVNNLSNNKAITSALLLQNSALESGTIYNEALKNNVENPVLNAITGGVIAGSLETVSDKLLLNNLINKNTINTLKNNNFKNVLTGVSKNAAAEGSTESAQSFVERAFSNRDLTNEEALKDYIESAAAGATVGGAVGGASNVISNKLNNNKIINTLTNKDNFNIDLKSSNKDKINNLAEQIDYNYYNENKNDINKIKDLVFNYYNNFNNVNEIINNNDNNFNYNKIDNEEINNLIKDNDLNLNNQELDKIINNKVNNIAFQINKDEFINSLKSNKYVDISNKIIKDYLNTNNVIDTNTNNIIDNNIVYNNVVDNNIVDNNIVDNNIVDNNIVDNNVVDTNIVDNNVVDTNIIDNNVIDTNIIDNNVIDTNNNNIIDNNVVDTNNNNNNIVDTNNINNSDIDNLINNVEIKKVFLKDLNNKNIDLKTIKEINNNKEYNLAYQLNKDLFLENLKNDKNNISNISKNIIKDYLITNNNINNNNNNNNVKNNVNELKLKNIVKNYNKSINLNNIEVKKLNNNENAYYDRVNNKIVLNSSLESKNKDEIEKILKHELVHASLFKVIKDSNDLTNYKKELNKLYKINKNLKNNVDNNYDNNLSFEENIEEQIAIFAENNTYNQLTNFDKFLNFVKSLLSKIFNRDFNDVELIDYISKREKQAIDMLSIDNAIVKSNLDLLKTYNLNEYMYSKDKELTKEEREELINKRNFELFVDNDTLKNVKNWSDVNNLFTNLKDKSLEMFNNVFTNFKKINLLLNSQREIAFKYDLEDVRDVLNNATFLNNALNNDTTDKYLNDFKNNIFRSDDFNKSDIDNLNKLLMYFQYHTNNLNGSIATKEDIEEFFKNKNLNNKDKIIENYYKVIDLVNNNNKKSSIIKFINIINIINKDNNINNNIKEKLNNIKLDYLVDLNNDNFINEITKLNINEEYNTLIKDELNLLNENVKRGYFEKKFTGEYIVKLKIKVKDIDNNITESTIAVKNYNTESERINDEKNINKIIEEIQKENNIEIIKEYDKKVNFNFNESTEKIINRLNLKGVDLTAEQQKTIYALNNLTANNLKRIFDGFGYDTNTINNIIEKNNEINSDLSNAFYKKEMNDLYKNKTNIQKQMIAEMYNLHFNKEEKTTLSKLRGFASFMFLGFNVSSAVLQFFQMLQALPVYHSQFENGILPILSSLANMSKHSLTAAKFAYNENYKSNDEELNKFLKEFKKTGKLDANENKSYFDIVNADKYNKQTFYAKFKNSAFTMFSIVEKTNRYLNAINSYYLYNSKDQNIQNKIKNYKKSTRFLSRKEEDYKKVDFKDLTDFVIKSIDEVNGDYSNSNNPKIFTGDLSQTLFMYKKFLIFQYEMFKHFDNKTKITYLSYLTLLTGFTSIPFSDDLLEILDYLLKKFGLSNNFFKVKVENEIKKISPTIYDIYENGILPTSVSSRLKMGNVINLNNSSLNKDNTTESLLLKNLGPVPQIFISSAKSVDALSNLNLISALKLQPFSVIKNSVNSYQMFVNNYSLDNYNNSINSKNDNVDPFLKLMGFTSSEDLTNFNKKDKINRIKYVNDSFKKEKIQEYIEARRDKDFNKIKQIREEINEYNLVNSGTYYKVNLSNDDLYNKFKTAQKDSITRTINKSNLNKLEDI